MNSSDLRPLLVFFFGFWYWSGVLILAARLRRRIGRAPNLGPKTFKEKGLWLLWLFVIAGWILQPYAIARFGSVLFEFFITPFFLSSSVMILGLILAVLGQAGTYWCYAALGDSWRIGVRENEKTALMTAGPYAKVRHPIYSFQALILAGTVFLLPTYFSLLLLGVHAIGIWIKASDEEAYLERVHGAEYRAYRNRTGRFLPKRF